MDSPLPSAAYPDLVDYLPSEADFSDSDWFDLDVPSDDLDSVYESDIVHRVRSRRSSISNSSSYDGVVEAWEGLVEDRNDDRNEESTTISPILPVVDAIDHVVLGSATLTAQDPHVQVSSVDDEERVMAALDQSMTSTLSHSHQSTVHSTRLELSFPDPLTSSRNELSQSYDDVAPSDRALFTTDTDDGLLSSPTDEAPQSSDVEPLTDVPEREDETHTSDAASIHPDPDLDVVLYGSSCPTKWQFIHELLLKVDGNALEEARNLLNVSQQDPRRQYISGLGPTFPNGVTVTDWTDISVPEDSALTMRPSLGILYLPLPPCKLPDHTYHLPVILQCQPRLQKITQAVAWSLWQKPHVSEHKLLPLAELPIRGLDHLRQLSSADLHDALLGRVNKPKRKVPFSHLTTGHATAFLTVMTLMVGLVVNITFRSWYPAPTPTRQEPGNTFVLKDFEPANHSVIADPTGPNGNCALIPSSLKDFALAVLNPSQPSATVVSSTLAPGPAATKRGATGSGVKDSDADSVTKPVEKGLNLRAGSSLSLEVHMKALSIIVPAQKKAEALTKSLSLRLTDSLIETLADTTALAGLVSRDMKEVTDALDALAEAIGRSTAAIRKQSMIAARAWQEQLQSRHERAQKKARDLKGFGQQVMMTANEEMTRRAALARNKAHRLKKATAQILAAHRQKKQAKKRLKRLVTKRVGSLLFRI